VLTAFIVILVLVSLPLAYVSWLGADPIPYTVEDHPVTGVYNGKLGIWLFLASEVMLFGALFSSLILLRLGAATWPRGWEVLNVPIGAVNTIVLITSSVTMVMAWASLKLNNFARGRLFLILTGLLALTFLVIKGFEYGAKFEHDLLPATSTYFAIYFTMTGLHGLHVLGGVLVIGYLVLTAGSTWRQAPGLFTNRVECTGLYWHFVDLVWIFLFPTLYLL
jgi:heme/copper-type cytochrome/quinol oxidase subunit 3